MKKKTSVLNLLSYAFLIKGNCSPLQHKRNVLPPIIRRGTLSTHEQEDGLITEGMNRLGKSNHTDKKPPSP